MTFGVPKMLNQDAGMSFGVFNFASQLVLDLLDVLSQPTCGLLDVPSQSSFNCLGGFHDNLSDLSTQPAFGRVGRFRDDLFDLSQRFLVHDGRFPAGATVGE